MSRSSHRSDVRNDSRCASILRSACFEALEDRRYLASPLSGTLPAIPGPVGGLVDIAAGAEGNQSQKLGHSGGSGVCAISMASLAFP